MMWEGPCVINIGHRPKVPNSQNAETRKCSFTSRSSPRSSLLMAERKVLASWGLDPDGSDSDDSFSSFSSPRQTKSLADGLGSYLLQGTDKAKMTGPSLDKNDQRWSQPITGFTSRFDPKYIEQQREQELMQAEQMSMQERSSYTASVVSEMMPLPPCEKPRPILRSQVRPITLMDILQERKEEMTKRPQRNHHDGRRKMMQVLGARDLYAEEMERRLLEDQRIQALEEQRMLQIKQTSCGKLRKSRSNQILSRQAMIQERPLSPNIPDLSNGTESSDDWTADIETRSSIRDESKGTSISIDEEIPSSEVINEVQDALETCDSTCQVESKISDDDGKSGLRELERQQEEAMKQAFELANADYLRKTMPPKELTPPPPTVSEYPPSTQHQANPANPLSADMQAFANSLDGILNRDPNQPPPRPKVEILPMTTVKAPPHRNGLPIPPSTETQSNSKRMPMPIGKYPPVLPHIGPIPKASAPNAAQTHTSSMQPATTAGPSQVPLIAPAPAPLPYALQMQYLAMTNPMLYHQMISQGAHSLMPMMMLPPPPPISAHYPSFPLRSSAPVVPHFSQYGPPRRKARPEQTLIQQQQAFMDLRRSHRHRELKSTLEAEHTNITPSTANLPAVERWRQHVVPERPPKPKKVFESDDEDDSDSD